MLKGSELEVKDKQASIISLIQNCTLTILPSAFLSQWGITMLWLSMEGFRNT